MPEESTPITRIPSAILMLALIGFGLGACAYVAPPRGISADIDATMWSGPISAYPGRTLDLRDEPEGAVPWHR